MAAYSHKHNKNERIDETYQIILYNNRNFILDVRVTERINIDECSSLVRKYLGYSKVLRDQGYILIKKLYLIIVFELRDACYAGPAVKFIISYIRESFDAKYR